MVINEMKIFKALAGFRAVTFGCVAFLLVAFAGVSIAGEKYQSVVTKIIDGDSLVVLHRGDRKMIRLYGIDSPEWNQPFAQLAKNYLERTVLNEKTVVQHLYSDNYGRSIALLSLRDININEELVAKGFVWVHRYYCKKKMCSNWRSLEKQARKGRRGLWQEKDPTPPWIWKNKRNG